MTIVDGPSWSWSVYITTTVVSTNTAHSEVYSIENYVIKFVRDAFSPVTPISSTNKTDRHDIAEILLEVALSTITSNVILKSSLRYDKI